MKTVLCIGDFHVGSSLTPYQIKMLQSVGDLIVGRFPDYVIIMGDFLTVDSLSAWDRNKRLLMEGRRYDQEIDAGNKALDILFDKVNTYNHYARATKKKQYRPRIVYLEGNHEDRLTRYLAHDPTFLGRVSISNDLNLSERRIEFVPYKYWFNVDGVGFTHIPHNSRGAVSSSGGTISVCKKALQFVDHDIVFGHTHRLEVAHKTYASGKQLTAVNVGCLVEVGAEAYMHGLVEDWWKGIVILSIDEGIRGIEAIPDYVLKEFYDSRN